MTKREMLMMVTEGAVVTAEMAEMAAKMVASMDKVNSQRAAHAATKRAEKNDPVRAALLGALREGGRPMTAAELVEAVDVEVKMQGVAALLKPLVEAGQVVKTEVKVEKRKLRAYALAEVAEAE